jgi:hypothetical protein
MGQLFAAAKDWNDLPKDLRELNTFLSYIINVFIQCEANFNAFFYPEVRMYVENSGHTLGTMKPSSIA